MTNSLSVVSIAQFALSAVIALLLNASASNADDIRTLPVPAGTIYPTDVITSAVVVDRRFKVTSTSVMGFATQRSEIIGKQARRRLAAGKPIPLSALGMPRLIRKGDLVSSAYRGSGFSIVATLTALQDGGEGETIAARNTETGRIVHALVIADGTLAVVGN
jgi:flagellar basal body P-ring formation protein FlgA